MHLFVILTAIIVIGIKQPVMGLLLLSEEFPAIYEFHVHCPAAW